MPESIRPYIVINGKSSREISGLLIVSLPPITKPQMRVTAEEIDGRDGDIVTELGFSAYDKPVEIGLAGDYDINEVISYFNQAGIITFSNEPDKYYKFAQYNGIDFEKLIRFKKATVIFHVQPFKYDTESNDAVFWNPENISITNEGNIYSKPELAIQGSGNVGIALNGSEVLSLELGETKQAIIIDTDKMNAYGTKSNVKELITDINPVQDLHGYDSVWIGGAGKNLFNDTTGTHTINANTDVTIIIGDVYLEANTTYTISCKQTPAPLASFVRNIMLVAGGGTTTYNSAGNDYTIKPMTFTPTVSGIYSIRVWGHTLPVDTTYSDFQVEKGSTATDWTPYENIGEITGWDGCDISRTGKNLCFDAYGNKASESTYLYPSGNNLPIVVNNSLRSAYAYVGKNQDVVVSFASAPQRSIAYGLESYPALGVICHSLNVTALSSTSFKLNSGNYDYIAFYYCNDLNNIPNNCQIELGNQATEFEAYNGQIITIDFGQTVFGGSLNVTTGLLTLTHVMTTIRSMVWNVGAGYFYSSLSLKAVGNSNFICEALKVVDVASVSQMNDGEIKGQATTKNMYIKNRNWSSSTDLMNAIGNTKIAYELAEPQQIQLTAEEIQTLIGNNNIWSNTGDISECIYTRAGADVTTSGAIISFEADASDLRDDILKNRLVRGNYDNLRLRAGANQLGITGDVDVLVLSNFSRWL